MRRRLAALALATLLPLPALAAEVVVRSGETLSDIAARHGVSVSRLMQINGIQDPDLVLAGTRLTLPGARSGGSSSAGGSGQARSHVVQAGETLSEIAERYGLSTSRLMQINGIRDPNLVVVGSRLTLRAPASTGGGGPRPAAASSGPTVRHTVRDGETLSEIAERHGLSTGRLMQLNGIQDPNLVFAGSQLQVPAPKPSARPAAPAAPPRPTYNRQAREHVVRPGETLSDIAEGYKVPLERLISLNGLKDPNTLITGSRLKLRAPAPVVSQAPPPKPAAPKPTAPKPTAANPAAPKPAAPKPAAPKPPAPAIASQPAPKPAPTPAPKPTATPAPQPAATVAPAAISQATTASPAATPAVTPAATPISAATTPTPTTQAAPPQSASPAPRPQPQASFAPATASTTPAPASTPAVTPRPATTAAPKATAAPVATAIAAKPATPDWRTYGPLQIDWANWHPMGGSFVAPSLNRDGQPLYLAVNCKARKINATSQAGQWNTWDAPQSDFERQLVTDICRQKGA